MSSELGAKRKRNASRGGGVQASAAKSASAAAAQAAASAATSASLSEPVDENDDVDSKIGVLSKKRQKAKDGAPAQTSAHLSTVEDEEGGGDAAVASVVNGTDAGGEENTNDIEETEPASSPVRVHSMPADSKTSGDVTIRVRPDKSPQPAAERVAAHVAASASAAKGVSSSALLLPVMSRGKSPAPVRTEERQAATSAPAAAAAAAASDSGSSSSSFVRAGPVHHQFGGVGQFSRPPVPQSPMNTPKSRNVPGTPSVLAGVESGDVDIPTFSMGGEIVDSDKYIGCNDAWKPRSEGGVSDDDKKNSIWYGVYQTNPDLLKPMILRWTGNKGETGQAFRLVDTRTGKPAFIRSPVVRVQIYENVPFGNLNMPTLDGATPNKFTAQNIFGAQARYGISFRAFNKDAENGCDREFVQFARWTESVVTSVIRAGITLEKSYSDFLNTKMKTTAEMSGKQSVMEFEPEAKEKALVGFVRDFCAHPFRRGADPNRVNFLATTPASPEFVGAVSFHVTTMFQPQAPRKSNLAVALEAASGEKESSRDKDEFKTPEEIESQEMLARAKLFIAGEVRKHNAEVPSDRKEAAYPCVPTIYAKDATTNQWRQLTYYEIVQMERCNGYLASFVYKFTPTKPVANVSSKPSVAPGITMEMVSMWIIDQNIGKTTVVKAAEVPMPACAQPFRLPVTKLGGASNCIKMLAADLGKLPYKQLKG